MSNILNNLQAVHFKTYYVTLTKNIITMMTSANFFRKMAMASACLLFSFTGIAQWTGTSIPTTTSGSVGIGTTAPTARLNINSLLSSSGGGYVGLPFKIENTSGIGGNEANLFEIHDQALVFPGPAPKRLIYWITNKGSVGIANSLRIGSTAANGAYINYKLSVDGDMIAKRCVIQVSNWADYVFNEDYKLPALREVEEFIGENKHLPGVPSEAEVKEQGIEIGEMNKILMQKIEELTLYIIEQDKKIKRLEQKVDQP